jgi:glycosyltransferase involved in cell wall biosynthesis
MKTLLLTDIPPSSNLTAGIVTAQMCRFIPPGELAIFCVQNRHLRPQPYPDLADIPIRFVVKPNELNRRSIRRIPIAGMSSIVTETFRRLKLISPLVRQAVAYGKDQNVTSLWVILQGQTMVRMASAVANGLGVPLRAQVWDPLGWWLQAHGVDRFNRRWDLAAFDRTMRGAVACAAASRAMASHFEQQYGIPSQAIISSLDRSLARRPEPRLRTSDELVIGMAGQFYASKEWLRLAWALERAGWQVAGRKVVVRVLGHQRPKAIREENLDFLGWRPQEDVVELLSNTCDILYCPYPFAASMAEVAKLSFPSKIPTYLAAGRPILFHGPPYAAPAHYLESRGAGFICRAMDPAAVYDGLMHLAEDEALYARLAKGAQEAFLADFTLDRMKKDVRQFLGYPEPLEG